MSSQRERPVLICFGAHEVKAPDQPAQACHVETLKTGASAFYFASCAPGVGWSAQVMHLDLSDLTSVRAFARAFEKKHDQLDVLVNNGEWCSTARWCSEKYPRRSCLAWNNRCHRGPRCQTLLSCSSSQHVIRSPFRCMVSPALYSTMLA